MFVISKSIFCQRKLLSRNELQNGRQMHKLVPQCSWCKIGEVLGTSALFGGKRFDRKLSKIGFDFASNMQFAGNRSRRKSKITKVRRHRKCWQVCTRFADVQGSANRQHYTGRVRRVCNRPIERWVNKSISTGMNINLSLLWRKNVEYFSHNLLRWKFCW